MSKSVNNVQLLGRLGKDPELTYTKSDTAVCKFSLATGDSYKDKTGKEVNTTEWHNIEIWEKLALIADQYLVKGSQVYIEGRLKTDVYEKNGEKKYSTKIVARQLVFLDKAPDVEKKPEPKKEEFTDFTMPEDDDTPF